MSWKSDELAPDFKCPACGTTVKQTAKFRWRDDAKEGRGVCEMEHHVALFIFPPKKRVIAVVRKPEAN